MNIQQLRYVVATADHGSMTAAAAALYVAQPALSRGVRQLERELGTTLFARTGRAAVPTAEGEVFVVRTRAVLRSIDALRDLRRVQDRADPPLVIAASPTLQSATAVPLLAALRDQGAAVPTRLVGCTSSDQVAELVATGGADVGLCDRAIPTSLPVVQLGRTEVRLYSPAGLDLPPRITVADLASVPLVLPSSGGQRREALDKFFAAYDVEPVVAVESDERSVWLAAVASGIASCIWHSVDTRHVRAGAIVARGFDPPLYRDLIAVHRETGVSPAAEHLLNVLANLSELRLH